MKIRFLASSEKALVNRFLTTSWTFLPFFEELSQVQETCSDLLRTQRYVDTSFFKQREGKQVVGVFFQGTLWMVAIVEMKKTALLVYSAHLLPDEKMTWTDFQQSFEQMVRIKRGERVRFLLNQALSPVDEERFIQDGFEKEGLDFFKEIKRTSALVLGGGGAKGSYEVGVLQYLEEENRTFSIIAGTSIGAATAVLYACGDLEMGKRLWEEIETKKIMAFEPTDLADKQDILRMVATIGKMTLTSIQNTGISIAPIYETIDKYYDLEGLQKNKGRVFIVTTEIPAMLETVVEVKTKPKEEWKDWLIASGSFFPTMKAMKIHGKYYIDGGYKNNVPVDVALLNGANDLVVVDVNGPGIVKKISIPPSVSRAVFKTPWQLGNVLLFDNKRSMANMELGYLEAKRHFERNYVGHWYTFTGEMIEEEWLEMLQRFHDFLKTLYKKSLPSTSSFLKKLEKIYQAPIKVENTALALCELIGKYQGILPIKAYTIKDFVEEIQEIPEQSLETEQLGLLSIGEWLQFYYNQFFVLSEVQQFQMIHFLLNVEENEKIRRVDFFWEKLQVLTILSLFKDFVEKEKNQTRS